MSLNLAGEQKPKRKRRLSEAPKLDIITEESLVPDAVETPRNNRKKSVSATAVLQRSEREDPTTPRKSTQESLSTPSRLTRSQKKKELEEKPETPSNSKKKGE